MRRLLLPGPLTGTPWYEGLGTRLKSFCAVSPDLFSAKRLVKGLAVRDYILLQFWHYCMWIMSYTKKIVHLLLLENGSHYKASSPLTKMWYFLTNNRPLIRSMLAPGIVQDTFAGKAGKGEGGEEETTGGYFYCYL